MKAMNVIALAASLVVLALPAPALAGSITANCTGMLDLDVYTFDSEQPTQEVGKLGTARFLMTADEIRLEGTFGVYRFDLKNGTLYHNDRDTGLYCTYRGLQG